jgi:hypothetical protein
MRRGCRSLPALERPVERAGFGEPEQKSTGCTERVETVIRALLAFIGCRGSCIVQIRVAVAGQPLCILAPLAPRVNSSGAVRHCQEGLLMSD